MGNEERDLRAYARGTQMRLILGGLALAVLAGNGLIWLIYGPGAARMGLLCSLAALLPLGLIAGWLWLLDQLAGRAADE